MTIKIGNYTFEGPFGSSSSLKKQSGVYAILGRPRTILNPLPTMPNREVVDIGESEDVKHRVENHDREDCWESRPHTILNFAAYYCDAINRMSIEKELRQKYRPPCGEH
ncbi:hypothetical protein [Candidatus Spongiihabitans sp.]|uniref:hypothetical protein n=1 Tax=Candidatus Spongiihabitans sp. TaxID=3101308 RepID=UPI003C7AE0B1